MDSKANNFYDMIYGKRIYLIGIGVSHRDLIVTLARNSAQVYALDKRSREELGEELCKKLENEGVTLKLGPDYLSDWDCDIILRTPGMNFNHPYLVKARQLGITVTSEMELFCELCPCRIFAVTGSDGKTTTTTLIAEMLSLAGYRVHKGGNLGRALLPVINEISSHDAAVVELSSFQLISMRCGPDVSVITNIAPNHLDVHKDMQEYIDAKKNIFLHQNAFSRTVLNADCPITKEMLPLVRGQAMSFSRLSPVEYGAFLSSDNYICFADRNGVTRLFDASKIQIPGVHNIENYLAAISAVWGYVDPEIIYRVAREFSGVEHRIEFVRDIRGVRWYNDSIGTSPTRTIAGLNCFDAPVILIAGGYDKNIPYSPLAPKLIEHVRVLLLSGPTGPKIEAALKASPDYSGKPEIIYVKDMLEAVRKAYQISRKGEIVMLSPASASFDAYPNFEARGEHFKKLVKNL